MKISADVLRSIQSSEKRKDMNRIGAKNVRARKESDAACAVEVPGTDLVDIAEGLMQWVGICALRNECYRVGRETVQAGESIEGFGYFGMLPRLNVASTDNCVSK